MPKFRTPEQLPEGKQVAPEGEPRKGEVKLSPGQRNAVSNSFRANPIMKALAFMALALGAYFGGKHLVGAIWRQEFGKRAAAAAVKGPNAVAGGISAGANTIGELGIQGTRGLQGGIDTATKWLTETGAKAAKTKISNIFGFPSPKP